MSWTPYPDGSVQPGSATGTDAAAIRAARRGRLGYGLAFMFVFLGALVVASETWPPGMFLIVGAVLAYAVGWHVRNRRRVHAGFEQWCAERGLRHSYGKVASGYPSAPHQQADTAAARTIVEAFGCRPATWCQAAGRMWESSGVGRITTVSTRRGDSTLEFTVVDVPLDASLTRHDGTIVVDAPNSMLGSLGALHAGDGWTAAAGGSGTGMVVSTRDGHASELLDQPTIARLAASFEPLTDGATGILLDRGRFAFWTTTSFACFGAALATAARTGLMRSPGAYAGGDVLLDELVLRARDSYRALLER